MDKDTGQRRPDHGRIMFHDTTSVKEQTQYHEKAEVSEKTARVLQGSELLAEAIAREPPKPRSRNMTQLDLLCVLPCLCSM